VEVRDASEVRRFACGIWPVFLWGEVREVLSAAVNVKKGKWGEWNAIGLDANTFHFPGG